MRDGSLISTVLAVPATTALIDVASLKRRLGVTSTQWDLNFADWISDATDGAQHYCNRIFGVQTVQDAIYPRRDGVPWIVRPDLDVTQASQWPFVSQPSPALTRAPLAPTLVSVPVAGLAAAAYSVSLTYVTPYGETPLGPAATLACSAGYGPFVPAPGVDSQAIAAGYNVYVSPVGGTPTLQNVAPLPVAASWTLPSSGLIAAGTTAPAYLNAIETIKGVATPLAAGVDFLADRALGRLYRLDPNGRPKAWSADPLTLTYAAGYTLPGGAPGFAALPNDVTRACVEIVKIAWYGQTRDPMIRQQNVIGVMETAYWFGSGPGSDAEYPPYVTALLDGHRVPVILSA